MRTLKHTCMKGARRKRHQWPDVLRELDRLKVTDEAARNMRALQAMRGEAPTGENRHERRRNKTAKRLDRKAAIRGAKAYAAEKNAELKRKEARDARCS